MFDIGLTEEEQHALLNIKKEEFILMVEILQYTQDTISKIPEFLTPYQFACKLWFIRFVFESSDIQNVFWIDSGIVTVGNIGFFFLNILKTWLLAN